MSLLHLRALSVSLGTSQLGNRTAVALARINPLLSGCGIPSPTLLLQRLRSSSLGSVYRRLNAVSAPSISNRSRSAPCITTSTICMSRPLIHSKRYVRIESQVKTRIGHQMSKRSYCSVAPKETPPPASSSSTPPTSTSGNASTEIPSVPPSGSPPPKHEHYGTYLWRKLKGLPNSLRRFAGLHGPMTLDKVLPFFNLMFVGMGVGILVGTTSVVSLAIWVVNRNDRWKELTAKKVGAYLTYQTGISIEYENMTASWQERRITLQNVKITRDPFSFPDGVSRNVTALALDVKKLTVSVSLMWLLQGNGLLKHVAADGVTGTIDQRHLDWTGWTPPRRIWQRGDFFLDSFQLANVNVSMYMIAPARELKVQIHSIDCEKLRKQWLLRDILSAKSAYGIFDGSLFSLTRMQKRSPDDENVRSSLKIDGVKSDLISTSSTGPISWITEGTIDIDLDIDFKKDNWEDGWHSHLDNSSPANGFYHQDEPDYENDPVLDVKIKLNNLRADIPISTDQLTIINKALVLPVIAYMNTNYTCIPLAFTVHVPREQFNGAWSPWEAGLFDAISTGVAQQFLTLVKEQQSSTNIQKHLLMVIKSLHRGLYFLRQQVQGYYSLWYFNNDQHPEDLYAL